MARITLRDVAEASGVSQSTVSFVLNEVPNQTISEATRNRVRAAARELGYVPHGIARALMEGSSRIVVLNIERAQEGHYSENFIRGLDKELALNGFMLLVRHGHPGPKDTQQIKDVISPRAVLRFGDAYMSEDPLQDSGGGWKNGMAAHVLLQYRYLNERGHLNVAQALPPGEPLADIRLRFAGEVAEMLDMPAVAPLLIPREHDAAVRALADLRSTHPQISAVAGFDDITALRVLNAMEDLGLEAPADLAVIGFDATEMAELSRPRLTTLSADAEGHGRQAARQALGLDVDGARAKLGRVIARESA